MTGWAETVRRLGYVFGGGEEGEAIAREWLRGALLACWGVEDEWDLPRGRRQVALQRLNGTVLRLEDEGDLFVFTVGLRDTVAAVFARHWNGVLPDGPPWRIDPAETDRPAYREWVGSASF